MKNKLILDEKKVACVMLALLMSMLMYLPAALGESEAQQAADADLGALVALIGTQDTVSSEHEFTLNHLLGGAYRKGDGGAEITIIKDRMKEIGYYTPTATYNSKFNEIMEERIVDFQESNGLYPTGVIDDETLTNLYAADPVKGQYYPKPYDEPELTMIIPQNSNLRSIPRENDVLSVGIEVKNISHQKRIIGYYLSIYTVDRNGKKIQEEIFDTTGLVPCGGKSYSTYIDLKNHSQIDKVYVGVKKVYYRDGSRTETIETPEYHCWML